MPHNRSSPANHTRHPFILSYIEDELVYVIKTDEGQETLTPTEFAKTYGWQNDPQQVTAP